MKLLQGLEQLRLLETQSGGHEIIGKRLWKGAGILRVVGDGRFEQELTAALNGRLKSLSAQVGDWQSYESEQGYILQHPVSWPVEYVQDGRYHSTYFRSPTPHQYAMVEFGERVRPTEATVIDWTGMERGLKSSAVRITSASVWAGVFSADVS